MVRTFLPGVLDSKSAIEGVEWSGSELGRAEGSRGVAESTTDDPIRAEKEFIQAIEAYKKSSGRMFPTWSEVLEVLTELGYAKSDP